MCLYPRLIQNRKYVSNKKNGGIIPAVSDKRVLIVPVGCGKCMECIKKKSREWQVRLLEEVKHDQRGVFVTLTFSNESIKELSKNIELEGYERDNEIAKIGVRRFLERWRKKYKKSVKHWLVTELGHNGTENIHMHGIIWTDKIEDIKKIWGYGYTWEGSYINEKTVNYITKYVSKVDFNHKEYKPRILTSAGIGKNYIGSINNANNRYKKEGTKEYYRTKTGHKIGMPIYYRNHTYSEEEKEKLWIEKLDKEKRYINGIEIDISKGEENYYKVLESERLLNKRLGYGDNTINWERKIYENQRRNELYKERIKKSSTRPRNE